MLSAVSVGFSRVYNTLYQPSSLQYLCKGNEHLDPTVLNFQLQKGSKVLLAIRLLYFCRLRFSAAASTKPARHAELGKWDDASAIKYIFTIYFFRVLKNSHKYGR